MKRWLSYIFPLTKKVPSVHNGTLELTWYNGKKHLNTKNTNYSYGSLQTILKTGLQHLDVSNCQNILLLGLGGGCVIDTLRQDFGYENNITAVDIDATIIEIAKKEYQHQESDILKLVCMHAHEFVFNSTSKFDLIIVDLFIDDQVPELFMQLSFWKQLANLFSEKGQLLFNASLNGDSNDLKHIEQWLSEQGFSTQCIHQVHGTNTLLIGQK